MNDLEYYGQFISDDSVIRLTNGVEMKGKYEVSKGILECCEIYHKDHMKMELIKYGAAAAVILTSIGVYKFVKSKKKKQETL